jgi:hypothetical protein
MDMAEQKQSIREVELSDEQWRSVERVIRNALKHGPKSSEKQQCCVDNQECACKCDEGGEAATSYN